MNPFIAFILGGFLLGVSNKTYIVQSPEKPKERPETGKCKACPEIGLYRTEYGFYADDFCYKQYKKYQTDQIEKIHEWNTSHEV